MFETKEIYVCILDFEATCEDNSPIHEVIEFPSVLYRWIIRYSPENVKTVHQSELQFISEYQEFVKPSKDPILSQFCRDLTHITQEQVNNGRSFPVVLQAHYDWLRASIPNYSEQEVYIMTCGNWDMATMAVIEYEIHRMPRESIPPVYLRFINIKNEFKACTKKGKRHGQHAGGLAAMLSYYHLDFIGQPHSGIDDCRNIARVFQKMVQDDGYLMSNQSLKPVAYYPSFNDDGIDFSEF